MTPEEYPEINEIRSGSVWEHSNGIRYVVLFLANIDTTLPEKYPISIVYIGTHNHKIWVKSLDNWLKTMREINVTQKWETS